jgi:predicted metal-binding membrane protein
MAALGGVMLYEMVAPHGRRLTPVVGAVLLTWGTAMILHPSWLPHALAGVA